LNEPFRQERLKHAMASSGDGVPALQGTVLDSVQNICKSGYMEKENTIEAFSALAQPSRMDAFKLIVMHEPEGIAAGEIARILDVPQNTMSTHLAILSRAGLITSARQSRSIIYRANFGKLRAAINYLLKDCCAGHPDICTPLIADIVPCCPPEEKRNA
jgi:DNA-binding transcriptional ArsR family regulator